MLYRLLFDADHYRQFLWNRKQILQFVDEHDVEHRVDIAGFPVSQKDIFPEALKISFEPTFPGDEKLAVPDVTIHEGRLYLNAKAYEALRPVIASDGEFLNVVDENGQTGFVFTPMNLAENRDAIDWTLSVQSGWAGFEHLTFDKEKLGSWQVFRTEADGYNGLFCQTQVVDAINRNNLTGVFVTKDLAAIHPAHPQTIIATH